MYNSCQSKKKDEASLLEKLKWRLSINKESIKDSNQDLPLINSNYLIGIKHLSSNQQYSKSRESSRTIKRWDYSLLNRKNDLESIDKYITNDMINQRETKASSFSNLRRNPSTPNMFLTINKLKVSNNELSNYLYTKRKFPREIIRNKSCSGERKQTILNSTGYKIQSSENEKKSKSISIKLIKFEDKNGESRRVLEENKESSMDKSNSKYLNKDLISRRIVFSKLNNKILCKMNK